MSVAGFSGGVSGAVATSLKVIAVLPLSVGYILDSFIRSLIPRRFRRRNIEGMTVLITGGGSGLGRLLAINLAKRGARIVIWGRNQHNLEETQKLVEAEDGYCKVYAVDVTDRESIYRTAADMLSLFGKIDILVNNAGIVHGHNLLESDDADIRNSFNVNAISHFYTTKAFLPGMIAQNSGHVVTVASAAGYVGMNRLTDYCSSKFAAVGFSEALTMELRCNGHTGIATTLVGSYFINTGMFSGVKSSLLPILSQEAVAHDMTDAILTRQKYCVPWFCNGIILLAMVLPDKLIYLLAKVMGLTESMKAFKGRAKSG